MNNWYYCNNNSFALLIQIGPKIKPWHNNIDTVKGKMLTSLHHCKVINNAERTTHFLPQQWPSDGQKPSTGAIMSYIKSFPKKYKSTTKTIICSDSHLCLSVNLTSSLRGKGGQNKTLTTHNYSVCKMWPIFNNHFLCLKVLIVTQSEQFWWAKNTRRRH